MLLTLTVFLPLLGLLVCLVVPERQTRLVNVLTSFAVLVLTAVIWAMAGNPSGYSPLPELNVDASWIPVFNIRFHMAVDGVGLSLLLLTAFVSFTAAIASWNIEKARRGYHCMFLLLLTGMLGVFVALDLFLFYIFWELMLLPMYFLIGVWGGPSRHYAAIKFFLYTLFGSVLLLAAIILVVLTNKDANGLPIWQIDLLAAKAAGGAALLKWGLAVPAFIGMFVAFAIKIPSFPFHTWLPDAHVEAPTPISMILAGILLKMGGFGMIRIAWPFFPEVATHHTAGVFISVLSVIAIVYGALVAMAQSDFKKLIAYSSVSHMGFVTLGLASATTQGLNGAMYMMLAHGTISAMLFMIVGVIYDRAHHRDLDRFGGLAWTMPRYAVLASFAFFASLGLPGLSGFIAEITTFVGAFANESYRYIALVGLLGVVITAAYYLITLQKVYLGETPAVYKDPKHYPDVTWREMAVLVPLAAVTLYMGVVPATAMEIYRGVTDGLVTDLIGPLAGTVKALGGG